MSQVIRTAIAAEVRRIQIELAKLTRMLATLDGGGAVPPPEKPARGHPRRPAADPTAVLAIIKAAGKINAVSLGHQLRKQGLAKIPTAQLVEAGVKVSGSKGGTAYSYSG